MVPVEDTVLAEAWGHWLPPGREILADRELSHPRFLQPRLIRQSASPEGTWKDPSWQYIDGRWSMLDSV